MLCLEIGVLELIWGLELGAWDFAAAYPRYFAALTDDTVRRA